MYYFRRSHCIIFSENQTFPKQSVKRTITMSTTRTKMPLMKWRMKSIFPMKIINFRQTFLHSSNVKAGLVSWICRRKYLIEMKFIVINFLNSKNESIYLETTIGPPPPSIEVKLRAEIIFAYLDHVTLKFEPFLGGFKI